MRIAPYARRRLERSPRSGSRPCRRWQPVWRTLRLHVQEAASAILASIADARVFVPLVDALSSRDWIVRMHAAKALGRIGDPEAVSALMPLLQDKVKAVREEVAGALAAIGGVAVLALDSGAAT